MQDTKEPGDRAELDIGGFRTSLVVRRDRRQVAYDNVLWRDGDLVQAVDRALTALGYQRTTDWESAGQHPSARQIVAAGGWYTATVTAVRD